jgi:chromosome segregation ATPase
MSSDASATDVALLKVTLSVFSISGLPSGSGQYYLRWTGPGGKTKQSPARAVNPDGNFSASFALYSKARREPATGAVVAVSNKPADTLVTTLALLSADSDAVVGQTPVDIAAFLTSGNSDATVTLKPRGEEVFLRLAVKSLGDGNPLGISLSRETSMDSNSSMRADAAVPSTVAVDTAAKLEQLRRDVVDKGDKISELRNQTAQIDRAIAEQAQRAESEAATERAVAADVVAALQAAREKADRFEGEQAAGATLSAALGSPAVPSRAATRNTGATDQSLYHQSAASVSAAEAAAASSEAAALQVRVRALEDERVVIERERAEAEHKVQAHVQHAAKIKTTYNQLAAWYNNLRQEHAELQARHPESTTEASRDLPSATVATTYEADARSFEKERDELQALLDAERAEKRELLSRNSTVLESKAATIVDLEHHRSNNERKINDLQKQIAAAKSEAQTNRELVTTRARDYDELAAVRAELAQLKASYEDELAELRLAASAEQATALKDASRASANASAQRDTDIAALKEALDAAALREAQDEESARATKDELEALRAELANERQELESVTAAESSAAIEKLNEQLSDLKHRLSDAQAEVQTALQAAEKRESQMDDIQKAADELRVELDASVDQLEREREEAAKKIEAAEMSSNTQVTNLTTERDHAIRELFRVRKAMNVDIKSLKKERDELVARTAQRSPEAESTAGLTQQCQDAQEDVLRLTSALADAECSLVIERENHSAELAKSNDFAARSVLLESAQSDHASRSFELETELTVLRSEAESAQTEAASRFTELEAMLANAHAATAAAEAALADETVLALQNAALGASVTDLKNKLESSQTGLAELTSVRWELAGVRAELESAQTDASEHIARIKELQSESVSLSCAQGQASRDLALAETQRQQAVSQMNAEVERLRLEVLESARTIGERDSENARLQKTTADAQAACSSAEAARGDMIVETSALSAELSSIKESMEKAARSNSSAETQLAEAQQTLAEVEAERGALASELGNVKAAMLSELSVRSEKEDEAYALRARIAELAASAKALEDKVSTSNRSLGDEIMAKAVQEHEIARLNASLTVAEAAREKLESESIALRASVAASHEATAASQKYVAEAKLRADALSTKLAEAERSKEMEIKSIAAAKAKLAAEMEELRSAATMSSASTAEAVSKATLLHEEIVSLQQKSEEASRLKQEVSDLKKELVDATSQRADPSKATKLSALEIEVGTLQKKLDDAESMRIELNEAKASAAAAEEAAIAVERSSEAKGLALRNELASMRRAAKDKDDEFSNLTELLKDMHMQHAQSTADYEKLFEEHRELKRSLDDTHSTQVARLRSAETTADAERQDMEDELVAAQDELGTLRNERQQLVAAVKEMQEAMELEEVERRKSSDARKDLRAARGRADTLDSELIRMKAENQELGARIDAMKRLEKGSADELVDELIRCKLDLANAFEQIDHWRRKVKQLDPNASPNVSGSKF